MSEYASFEFSELWKRTLSREVIDPEPATAGALEQLRNGYLRFREQALLLAGEISRDLPTFTVHDGTHLDALWHLACPIAGSEIAFTPSEAFVFGGAVLLHDLGLGTAAYPEGPDALTKTDAFQDALWMVLKDRLKTFPMSEDFATATPDDHRAALGIFLRERHADQAGRLGLAAWEHPTIGNVFLIEDPRLREAYGWLIGRIAASHWWPVERLAAEFRESANSVVGPSAWTVDPLKLACLLRLVDAAHLDVRRAPHLLRAVRRPEGIADRHWAFQERLQPVRVNGDRLYYSSGRPFGFREAAAWWLCFDTLRAVDDECRSVDALLADLQRPRFAVTGVFGSETPDRLARVVQTDGWQPVRAEFRASNIRAIIERLGGVSLYGSDPLVPIRELVQNAADAIRARRVAEGRGADWGEVTVATGVDEDGYFLEVRDTGLGMSAHIVAAYLLDFGNSLWESPDLPRVIPGLANKKFRPTGHFGIGFFSTFMLGDRVRVTSRRFDLSPRDTIVLELHGFEDRPLLRTAERSEQIVDGGTAVRVWLREHSTRWRRPAWLDVSNPTFRAQGVDALRTLCAYLCPTLDVTLCVDNGDAQRVSVLANDWTTMPAEDLLARIGGPLSSFAAKRLDPIDAECARTLTAVLTTGGETVGRLSIPNSSSPVREAVVTVGGLRAQTLSDVAGVVVGRDPNVARSTADLCADDDDLVRWATAQATLHAENPSQQRQRFVAGSIFSFGGDASDLFVCSTKTGVKLTLSALREWAASRSEVLLTKEEGQGNSHPRRRVKPLPDDALVVPGGSVAPPRWFSATGPSVTYAQVITNAVLSAWNGDAHTREELHTYAEPVTRLCRSRDPAP